MRYRLILPTRLQDKPIPKVLEKDESEVSQEWLLEKNRQGYNIYFFPNGASKRLDHNLGAKDVDDFNWVFVDMDLKDNLYKSKEDFLNIIRRFPLKPTKTIDSGHGIHVYWKISNLDRQSYMELQKGLINKFKTDQSIWTITQLMRVPGFKNTKYDDQIECILLNRDNLTTNKIYSVEDMWAHLDEITDEDRQQIDNHINKYIHGIEIKPSSLLIEDVPDNFKELLDNFEKLRELFYHPQDRSVADMQIANILYVNKFTEEQAVAILSQTNKGKERGISYVYPIVQKIYHESPPSMDVLDTAANEFLKIANLQELQFKKMAEIKNYKVDVEYKKVVEAKSLDEKHGNFTLAEEKKLIDYYLRSLEQEDKSMDNALPCITPALTKVVPLYGKEIVLIGATTGAGKSTVCANIVEPLLAKKKRIAYISTEEKAEDIIVRVASLQKNMNFANRRNWRHEDRQKRNEALMEIVKKGNFVVYDSYTPGRNKKTNKFTKAPDLTTLEGLEIALKDIEDSTKPYDLVILDYITKVESSTKNYTTSKHQVMMYAMKLMEEWSKKLQIPFLIMAQLKPKGDIDEGFMGRLMGSRQMLTMVTCAIEVKTQWEEKTGTWICHKARNGQPFIKTVRFEKGRYIDAPSAGDTVED